MRKTSHFSFVYFLVISIAAFGQRDTIALNDQWAFRIDSNNRGVHENWISKNIPNAKSVTIPHTWNVEKETEMYYGTAWYQKQIFISEKWKSKRIVLQFGAINHSAKIYLNGKFIAAHIGDGFNLFKLTLDSALLYGQLNLLTISADNSFNQRKVPFGSSFDWPNDGGLIRKVNLILSDKASPKHIQLFPQYNFQNQSGSLKIQLDHDLIKQKSYRFEASITEENQATKKPLYRGQVPVSMEKNSWIINLNFPKVNAWQFDSPNLYRVTINIWDGPKQIDQISGICGFKDFKFDHGYALLNGESVRMIGVEWTAGSNPNFGFAEPDSVILRYARLMKTVNTVFTRQHFQQDELFYDYCDRNGILVQQEIPLWGPETPGNDSIRRIAEEQLKEMIENLHNHCSIIAWGVGNELRGRDADIQHLVSGLLDKARAIDPSRLASYVSNTLNNSYFNHPQFVPDVAAKGDYIAMNEYGGSWWKVPEQKIGNYLDSVHMSYPNHPFIISEFGLCEPNFSGGDQRRILDLKSHLAIYNSKPYIAAAIYFDLTDYRTHYPGTSENNKYRRRIHGVYDMYGSPKPSMEVLRDLSSPIEIPDSIVLENGIKQIRISARRGLPQYTAIGYWAYLSKPQTNYFTGTKIKLPNLEPGASFKISLPSSLSETGTILTIVRPNGSVVIQKNLKLVQN